jgi:acetyltransferase
MSQLILPTPTHVWVAKDKKGNSLQYRPIIPDDVARLANFHTELSAETVYSRWMINYPERSRVDPERLRVQCTNSDRGFAIVTLDAKEKIVGVGRAMRDRDGTYELAFVVRDRDQLAGVGQELFRGIIAHAEEHQFAGLTLTAIILGDNVKMRDIFRKNRFTVKHDPDDYTTMRAKRVICP